MTAESLTKKDKGTITVSSCQLNLNVAFGPFGVTPKQFLLFVSVHSFRRRYSVGAHFATEYEVVYFY